MSEEKARRASESAAIIRRLFEQNRAVKRGLLNSITRGNYDRRVGRKCLLFIPIPDIVTPSADYFVTSISFTRQAVMEKRDHSGHSFMNEW